MRTVIASLLALAVVVTQFSVVQASPPTSARASEAVDAAWQLYQLGNCSGAQNRLSDVLSLAPQYTPIYFDLGVSAERCGNQQLAANYYRMYANADPQQRGWVSERAALLEQQVNAAVAQPNDQRRGFPWWGWALIGGGVLLLAAIGLAASSSEDPSSSDEGFFASARFQP
jgi:hypothetical protein